MRLNNNTIIFSMILHPLRSWFDFYCYYYISIYEKFKKSLLSNPLQRVIYTIYQECFWNIQSAFTWMNLIEINKARYNIALRLICNLVTCDKGRHAKKCRFFVIKKEVVWLINIESIYPPTSKSSSPSVHPVLNLKSANLHNCITGQKNL